jgi:hypothetical protein
MFGGPTPIEVICKRMTTDDTGSTSCSSSDGNGNGNDKNSRGLVVALELSDDIRHEEIVHKFEFDARTSNLVLCLNHRYKQKIVISSFMPKKWSQSIGTFEDQIKSKGVTAKHINQLCELVDSNHEQISNAFLESIAAGKEEGENQQQTLAQKLVRLAKEQCEELFVDQYNEPYAAVKIRGHLETLNLNYSRFKSWICKAYYQSEGSVPNSESITNAINVLKANAEFDGNSKELYLRVAYGDTKEETRTTRTTIFYDLTNKDWEAVKISSEGWTIEKAPVIFRRHNAQPQVCPSKEYPPDIFDMFMRLLNVNGEERKLLVKCYIIASFIPEFDRPILMLHGDPGAAKSTLQELIKTLVDPSSVLTFALPSDVSELVQQLDHNHIAFYDNVSKIPYWISDQFCRASTGGGSSKRRLFTDDDDKIYNFRRCVGFNGINLAATKSDLLDRGLTIQIERIDDKVKRKKEHIWRDFERIRPQLLGYIFDILVKVLSMMQTSTIKFEKLPRMADFAEIGEIISRCMGNPDNQFIDAYYENIKLQTEQILDASLVASAMVKLMSELNEWKGTATELLEQLDTVVGEKTAKNKYWPKTSSVLSRRINEIRTNLRDVGIIVEAGQSDPTTRTKTIVITKASDKPGELGKMPLDPLEPLGDQNRVKVASDKPNGISDIAQMPLDKDHQNRVQNTSPNGMNGMNGILRKATDPISGDNDNDKRQELGQGQPVDLYPNAYWNEPLALWCCNHCKHKGDKFDMINHVGNCRMRKQKSESKVRK